MDNQPSSSASNPSPSSVVSGLSGNEMYCAALLGMRPGNIIIGNSVFSMGVVGGMRTSVKTVVGGEVTAITSMIQGGRLLAYNRLAAELKDVQGCGVTGVSSELILHGNNAEFLSVGSAVHANTSHDFTTSANAQELFCQMDAGYEPVSFVFGNVAYSIGLAGHLLGGVRELAKGEVHSFSDVFNHTRQLALQRIVAEAQAVGANSVVGIETTILPFGDKGVQEMIMVGTASRHPLADHAMLGQVLTSDLTAEETWNVIRLGYMPVQLVLGTSVYALGVAGGIKSALQEIKHGEVTSLTQMIYGAREQSIAKLRDQASEVQASDVLGIKTYIYDLGGDLIELLTIGTAVKKIDGLSTRSPQLPPQAVSRDKDTFVNSAQNQRGVNLNTHLGG